MFHLMVKIEFIFFMRPGDWVVTNMQWIKYRKKIGNKLVSNMYCGKIQCSML